MKQVEGAEYRSDDVKLAANTGWFFAHIVDCTPREINSRFGRAIAYEPQVLLAQDNDKHQKQDFVYQTLTKDSNGNTIEVPLKDDNGVVVVGPPNHMIGRKMKANTIWFNPEPGDERWRNEAYLKFADALGVEFPSTKTDKGVTITNLMELEAEDILGKPVLVRIGKTKYNDRNDNNRLKTTLKPVEFIKWPDGKEIDVIVESSGIPSDNSPPEDGDEGLPF